MNSRRRTNIELLAVVFVALAPSMPGCKSSAGSKRSDAAPASFVSTSSVSTSSAPAVGTMREVRTQPATSVVECPKGTARVDGGTAWIGSPGTKGPPDEHPRFQTKLPALCVDITEVTVASYRACVDAAACQVEQRPQRTCNYGREGREQHPINCVTWDQAEAYCHSRGARLPTEIEWEYAARGGSEARAYSWGNEPPDSSRTCWKRPHSCEVGSFGAGAFGLLDMIGNVWEWTSSNYGVYPWPPASAPHKIYRGGSWSRRFDKWMSPTLRNRWGTDKWGSHLGFRCVHRAPGTTCPYGEVEGACLHGVEDVECPPKTSWNGARCAKLGAPQCPEGQPFVNGRGCETASRIGAARPAQAGSPATGSGTVTDGVTSSRSPQFDTDCREHQPARPKAYRLQGGSHAGRNQVGRAKGCKNRDVGVGWNSACCP